MQHFLFEFDYVLLQMQIKIVILCCAAADNKWFVEIGNLVAMQLFLISRIVNFYM